MNNKILRIALAAILILALTIMPVAPWNKGEAAAKTSESPRADNLFFYVKNSVGQDILLKTYTLADLEAMAHPNPASTSEPKANYYYSATDNFPAAAYTEAQGFTVAELIEKIKTDSGIPGADSITFTGADKLDLMATDGGGTYARSWSYDELCGQQGYYYPGIFKAAGGWSSVWEVSGDGYNAQSWPPMPLATYISNHQANDPTYAAKAAASGSGIEMPAIFAVKSEGDRIGDLESVYEINRNNVTGSLSEELNTDRAVTLCIPQTPDVLFSGNRTMYHYFAWIYNIRLNMASAPVIAPSGEVAEPTAIITDNAAANEVLIDFACDTEGADIYYTLDKGGSPALKYTPGTPVTVDVTGRDIKADPVRIYYTAVKEGYTDKGAVSTTYPNKAPGLNNAAASFIDQNVILTAQNTADTEAWQVWAALLADPAKGKAYVKAQTSNTYSEIPADKFSVSITEKTITIDASQFTSPGSYNLRFEAPGYTHALAAAQLKQRAPQLSAGAAVYYGDKAVIPVNDSAYLAAVSGISIKKQASKGAPYPVSTGAYAKQNSSLIIDTNGIPLIEDKAEIYIISVTAQGYEPAMQEISLEVKSSGDAPGSSFTYSLAASKTSAPVGDLITLTASLTSAGGAYTFYAGEYRLKIPGKLSVTDISPVGGWEYGVTTSGDDTILTFAKLDTKGRGISHKRSSDIGTFKVSGKAAGAADISAASALVTDEYAFARSRVSREGQIITITTKAAEAGQENSSVAASPSAGISDAVGKAKDKAKTSGKSKMAGKKASTKDSKNGQSASGSEADAANSGTGSGAEITPDEKTDTTADVPVIPGTDKGGRQIVPGSGVPGDASSPAGSALIWWVAAAILIIAAAFIFIYAKRKGKANQE
jgi:hypothetical protein